MGPVSSPHTAASGKERTQHQVTPSSKLGKSDRDSAPKMHWTAADKAAEAKAVAAKAAEAN